MIPSIAGDNTGFTDNDNTLHRGRWQYGDHRWCSRAMPYHQADDITKATPQQCDVTSYQCYSTNVMSTHKSML